MFKLLSRVLVCCLMSSSIHSLEIQGHRGTRGTLPENTIPGFVAAIEAGVNGMEMDLLMTSDGQIVIHHEFFVNPTLCCYLDGTEIQESPLIKDMSLSDLKNLDCGTLTNPRFPNQQHLAGTLIPTLEELLVTINSMDHPNAKKVRLNLEVKAKPQTPHYLPSQEAIAQKIVQIVNGNGFEGRICYTSFDFEMLQQMRNADPSADLGLIFEEATLTYYGVDPNDWTGFIAKTATALNAKIAAPDFCLLSASNIAALHEANLRVIPWTVNQQKDLTQLVEMGVDGIITDYPEKMLQLRADLGL